MSQEIQMRTLTVEQITMIVIGSLILILLIIIMFLLIIGITGKTIEFNRKVPSSLQSKRISRLSTYEKRSRLSSQRSDSMFFTDEIVNVSQPFLNTESSMMQNSSRVIVVAEDDIRNYSKRYDVVLLKSFTSASHLSELQTPLNRRPQRKARRSLPITVLEKSFVQYIDV
jgi:hypothetical protein